MCEHLKVNNKPFEALDDKIEGAELVCSDCGEQIGFIIRDIQIIKEQIPKIRFILNSNVKYKASDLTLKSE